MTKWPVQKLQGTTQKLLQHHDATDIKKTYIFVFFGFFFFYFLFIDNFLKERQSYFISRRFAVYNILSSPLYCHTHKPVVATIYTLETVLGDRRVEIWFKPSNL